MRSFDVSQGEQLGSGVKWEAPVHGKATQSNKATQVNFEYQKQVAPQPKQQSLPPYQNSFFDDSSAPTRGN